MNRRQFLVSSGAISAAAATLAPRTHAADPSRPNIIFILVDDMGFSDIGCYGAEIETPNLDRLAAEGLRMTQMHNTSKCFPSRACLLTGVYAQQCGMDKSNAIIRNAMTLGEVMRGAGYRTLASGKHHGKENLHDRGFDRYYGLRDGCCNFFNPGDQRPGEAMPIRKQARVWCIDQQTFVPYTPEDRNFYTTDAFTDHAIAYIEEYKDEDKPFLLYLSYTAPHDPLMARPEDIAKYQGKYMQGYAAIRDARHERQKQLGVVNPAMPLSAPTFTDWDSLSDERKVEEDLRMAIYAAMIDVVDRNIGRLLETLKRTGRYENTLIMFAADNGSSAENAERGREGTGPRGSMTRWTSLLGDWANVGNTPYRLFKNNSHEGGICTPFIAWWPEVIKHAGGINHDPAHFIDVMATLVDITGAPYPEEREGERIVPLQGVSLLPIFQGEPLPDRGKPIYWQWKSGKAVREGKWKAVAINDRWELYDFDKDRNETNDLAEAQPETLKRMIGLHQEWAKSVGG